MKNKYFYYIIVASEGQAKFVTSLDNSTKNVYWETDKPPLPLAKSFAEDIAYCLNLNLYPAFVIESFHEIKKQIFYKEQK